MPLNDGRGLEDSWNLFIEAYSNALGVEKATSLLEDGLLDIGLSRASRYDKRDAKRLCEHLKSQGGIVKIIATAISTRLIISGGVNK